MVLGVLICVSVLQKENRVVGLEVFWISGFLFDEQSKGLLVQGPRVREFWEWPGLFQGKCRCEKKSGLFWDQNWPG